MRVGLVGDVHGRVLLVLAALVTWQRRAGHRFDLIVAVSAGMGVLDERIDAECRILGSMGAQ